METKKLLTFSLIVLGLIGISGMASATLTLTDGNDDVYFDGEILTLSNWDGCATASHNYLWIVNASNMSDAYIGNNGSNGLVNGSDMGYQVCSYNINLSTNITKPVGNASALQLYGIFIRANNSATSPNIDLAGVSYDASFNLNNFSIAISPDYNSYGVLNGDNATLEITTTGSSTVAVRGASTFNVVTTEGVTAVKVTNASDLTSGKITYKIPVSAVANKKHNVTVTNGYSNRSGSYAVRELKVLAYDLPANRTQSSTVVLQIVNETGGVANFSILGGTGDIEFTLTISNRTDDHWDTLLYNYSVNMNASSQYSGNTTIHNVTTGSTAGTGTITASCNNFTLTASDTYNVYALGVNITTAATYHNGTQTTSFYIPQNVTVGGWVDNTSSLIVVNISLVNGTKLTTLMTNSTTPQSDGTWNVTFNMSTNWSLTPGWPTGSYIFPNGSYVVKAAKNGSSLECNATENASMTITLSDILAVNTVESVHNGTVLYDEAYVDDLVYLNGTSTRINGATVYLNVTGTNAYVNSSITDTVDGAQMFVNGTNGTFSLVWNTSAQDREWTGSGLQVNGTGTYTAFISNQIVNVTKTFTVRNNLTVDAPSTGPVGSTVNITGTSTRRNGTTIWINVYSGSLAGIPVLSMNWSNVTGYKWSFNWTTTQDGKQGGTALTSGQTYYISVTDNITTTTDSILLGAGTVDVSTSKAIAYIDDMVDLSGTTTYPAGTWVTLNVTNGSSCTGPTVFTQATQVNTSQMFNVTWLLNGSTTPLRHNVTPVSGAASTLCVRANVSSSASDTTTMQIIDNISLSVVTTAVAGDKVVLTGTSSRTNGTTITVTVAGSDYTKSKTPAVVIQDTLYGTGTFTDDTYYATVTGLSGGAALPAGVYNVTATDGVVNVTSYLTITSTGTITITTPTTTDPITQYQSGTQIPVEGTSTRVNGTAINITVSGLNSTTVNTIVNAGGTFNATWNTTGYLAGYYTLQAQPYGQTEFDSVTVYLTAAPTTTTTSTTTTTVGEGTTTTTAEGTTTTTAEGTTTTTGATTTTTTPGACVMPGNYEPCNEVALAEVVDAINAWSSGDLTLASVIDLINSWSDSSTYPAT